MFAQTVNPFRAGDSHIGNFIGIFEEITDLDAVVGINHGGASQRVSELDDTERIWIRHEIYRFDSLSRVVQKKVNEQTFTGTGDMLLIQNEIRGYFSLKST